MNTLKYKSILFSSYIIFILFFPNILFGQNNLDTLSLSRLINIAKERSITSNSAKTDLEIAQLNFQVYRAGLKPQLLGTANLPNFANTFAEIGQDDGSILFQRINNNNSSLGLRVTQEIPLTGGAIFLHSNLQRFDDFTNNFASYNGTPFRIGVYQPLFGFNSLKWDKRLEPLKLREAEKKYTSEIEGINIQAVQLFFNLLVAHENLVIANSNKTSNETLFTIAEEKFELGKISESDLLQLRLELVSASKDKKRAEQSVRLASSTLYTFLGLEHDGQMIIPLIPETQDDIQANLITALQEASSNRFEQTTFTRMLMEAERDLSQTKREGGLQADLTASFGLSRGATNISDIYNDPQQQEFVQLQLSIPIIDWGMQKSKVGIAVTKRNFTQKRIQQDKLQIEAEIKQAIDAFNNLQEELQLNKTMKQLSQERFDITKQSFVLGAISLTELTLAQREKDQSAREYIFTLSQYWQNYYALRALTIYDFEKQRKINHLSQ